MPQMSGRDRYGEENIYLTQSSHCCITPATSPSLRIGHLNDHTLLHFVIYSGNIVPSPFSRRGRKRTVKPENFYQSLITKKKNTVHCRRKYRSKTVTVCGL